MANTFADPIIHDYFSESEKQFRKLLPVFLNKSWLDKYNEPELLDQSNASVVYKVMTEDGISKIIKFSSDPQDLILESFALSFWSQHGVSVPQVYNQGELKAKGLTGSYIEMEYISGQNLLTLIQSGEFDVNPVELARLLKRLSIRDFPEDIRFPLNNYSDVTNFPDSLLEGKYLQKVKEIITENKLLLNSPSVILHADFREGNILIKKNGELVLIDPNPLLGHPYSDLAYYIILSRAYSLKKHIPDFLTEYFSSAAPDYKELWLFFILEAVRMYESWSKKGDSKVSDIMLESVKSALDSYLTDSEDLSWLVE